MLLVVKRSIPFWHFRIHWFADASKFTCCWLLLKHCPSPGTTSYEGSFHSFFSRFDFWLSPFKSVFMSKLKNSQCPFSREEWKSAIVPPGFSEDSIYSLSFSGKLNSKMMFSRRVRRKKKAEELKNELRAEIECDEKWPWRHLGEESSSESKICTVKVTVATKERLWGRNRGRRERTTHDEEEELVGKSDHWNE